MYQRRQLKVDETKESLFVKYELRKNLIKNYFNYFIILGSHFALHTTIDRTNGG